MSHVEIRDLGAPEAVVSYPLRTSSQVRLAETVVTRHLLQPGWSWEEHTRCRSLTSRPAYINSPECGSLAGPASGQASGVRRRTATVTRCG
jgi:hypothetical protein